MALKQEGNNNTSLRHIKFTIDGIKLQNQNCDTFIDCWKKSIKHNSINYLVVTQSKETKETKSLDEIKLVKQCSFVHENNPTSDLNMTHLVHTN